MTQTSWTVNVELDSETGELILPLPQELLEGKGWVEGDELEWIDNRDGSWTLEKVEKDAQEGQE